MAGSMCGRQWRPNRICHVFMNKSLFSDVDFILLNKNIYYIKYKYIAYNDVGKGHPHCQIMLKFPTKDLCEANLQHLILFLVVCLCA